MAMIETRLSELFFRQGPQPDGALPEAEVNRLNLALARRYFSVDGHGEAVDEPPEPLPAGSMRYPAFRAHLHRALAHLSADPAAQEQAVRRLIRDLGHKTAGDEEAPRDVQLFERPGRPGGDVPDIETSDLEEREEVNHSTCWAPSLPLSPSALTERLRQLILSMDEHEQGQETLKMVQAYTASALGASRRALELARSYGGAAQALGGRLQGLAQVEPRELLRSLAPAACDDEPRDRVVEVLPVPRRWRFDAGDGLHADPRALPDLASERTGFHVLPGETFEASQELRGADGVLYLELADGRGWLFEAKPGVGTMCTLVPTSTSDVLSL